MGSPSRILATIAMLQRTKVSFVSPGGLGDVVQVSLSTAWIHRGAAMGK
jgi:hypothetical protein